jgi:hypothetical protein
MAASGNFHTDRNLTVQRTQALSDGCDYSLPPAFWFVGTGTIAMDPNFGSFALSEPVSH